jgi:predicted ATPase/class 3 adenylate cyclase
VAPSSSSERSVSCQSCSTENESGSRFCSACGAALELSCASCGSTCAAGDRFCRGCGRPLSAAPGSGGDLAAKTLLHQPGGGERKHVTVMFADLKGSTAAIEQLDPEAALGELEPSIEIMVRLVQRYEGVVCRRLGDGILALFGAPVAHEDHAVRACFAAIGIQRELRNAGMGETVRIGLSSGSVLYRTISSAYGLEVDVVGMTVHMAARMEQMAPPGSVYLTAQTQALTQGLIETRNVGLHEVKGASAPVDIYEATGAFPYRSRWQASATRERAPFAGRKPERARLAAALSALAEGRGGAIGICGEAGLGKSRLVRSVVVEEGKSPARYTTIIADATAFGGDVPYHVLVSAFRDLFGMSENDDAARSRGLVAAVLEQIDPALADDAPILSSLISLSSATPEWLAMEPRRKRGAVLDSCVRLARTVVRRRPMLLVFEDMHWVDRDTEEVLRAIVDLTHHEQLLVVLTYRTEYDDSWLRTAGGERLRIAPLGDDDVRRSLREWFVEGPEADALIERVVTRVEGSPLFAEECLRGLAQRGALTTVAVDGEGSAPRRRYVCWEAPGSLEIPLSVHDVIASRIERRSPDCLALLRTLSVVTRRIPSWLFERISGQPPATTEATLREAITAEILMSANLSPDMEYDFTHAVLREVAYGSLTRALRVEAHRRIFAAVEAHHANRAQEQAEWLAYHASEGELWEQAALYHGHAAERALIRGSYIESIAGFRIALRSYEQSSKSVATTQRAIDHLLRLRRLLSATGVISDETRSLVARAEQLAQGIGDRERLAWAWNEQCGELWSVGEYREAVATARRCIEIAQQAGEARLQASALQRLGVSLHAIGDCEGAAQALRQCQELLTGELRFARIASTFPTYCMAGGYLVVTLCDLGRYDEAEQRLVDLSTVAAATRDIAAVATAELAGCALALARGDTGKTIPLLEIMFAAAKGAGAVQFVQLVQIVKHYLGRAKLLAGDLTAAADLLNGVDELEVFRRSYVYRLSAVYHAEALAEQGALDRAEAILDGVEGDVAVRGEAGTLAKCRLVRAKVAVAAGDLSRAETAYRQALEQATVLSLVPVCQKCEAGLAAIASRQSRPH